MPRAFLCLVLIFPLLASVVRADTNGLAGTSDTKPEKVPFDPAKWSLAWADEFDQPGAPDPALWVQEKGYLRNGEKQYYTTGRPENARVENGVLVIEARTAMRP